MTIDLGIERLSHLNLTNEKQSAMQGEKKKNPPNILLERFFWELEILLVYIASAGP